MRRAKFCATRLFARGIFALSGGARFQAKNCFAFLHQIESIACDCFEIDRVSLEQIDLASLSREQSFLVVHLRLEIVDLRRAVLQFLVRRDEQTDDDEPSRDEEEDLQYSIEPLPNCGFAPRA